MRIEPTHDSYNGLFGFWESQGKPARFSWGGVDYLAIRDNDIMVFVRTGSASGFDSTYDISSIPMK